MPTIVENTALGRRVVDPDVNARFNIANQMQADQMGLRERMQQAQLQAMRDIQGTYGQRQAGQERLQAGEFAGRGQLMEQDYSGRERLQGQRYEGEAGLVGARSQANLAELAARQQAAQDMYRMRNPFSQVDATLAEGMNERIAAAMAGGGAGGAGGAAPAPLFQEGDLRGIMLQRMGGEGILRREQAMDALRAQRAEETMRNPRATDQQRQAAMDALLNLGVLSPEEVERPVVREGASPEVQATLAAIQDYVPFPGLIPEARTEPEYGQSLAELYYQPEALPPVAQNMLGNIRRDLVAAEGPADVDAAWAQLMAGVQGMSPDEQTATIMEMLGEAGEDITYTDALERLRQLAGDLGLESSLPQEVVVDEEHRQKVEDDVLGTAFGF